MTFQLNIDHGGSYVREEDKARAELAAWYILKDVDCAAAAAAYRAAIEDDQNESDMVGLAAIWAKAGSAANIALTEGWADPNGAYCSLHA